MKTFTVYYLRVRPDDKSEWGEPEPYPTRKARDKVSAECRILAGLRTHSYEEKKTLQEFTELFNP